MLELREVDQEEWISLSTPDVYFTFDYYEASKLVEQDFSRILLLEWSDENGKVCLPLIIRSIQNTKYFDATSAYGYGGPWIEGNPNLSLFLDKFNQWASENNVVCTFLRFHPLLRNAEAFLEYLPVRHLGPTAGWDLKKAEDLVAGMSKSHRKGFRRALRAGVEARVSSNPSKIEDFKMLYNASMDRLDAAGFYRFSDEYWEQMSKSLGKSAILVEAIFEGRVVAAVWCLTTENYLHFHLSGTSDEGRELGGSVVCRVAAAQWAQERGLTMAHFGGGAGGENSTLLKWKHRFDESLPFFNFQVAGIIHQEEFYSRTAANYPDVEFFPPWRIPEEDVTHG